MIKLFETGTIYDNFNDYIFIFSEILPKTYAIRKAEALILNTAPVTTFNYYILSPVSITVHKLVRLSLLYSPEKIAKLMETKLKRSNTTS